MCACRNARISWSMSGGATTLPKCSGVIRRGAPGDLAQVAAIQAASPEAAQWDAAGYLLYDFRVSVRRIRVAGFLVSGTLVEGETELLNLGVAPGIPPPGSGAQAGEL